MSNFFSKKKFFFNSSSTSSSNSRMTSLSSTCSDSSSSEWPRRSYSPGTKKKRLTRQKKLRHVSGEEFGLSLRFEESRSDRSQSLPVSPDSERLSPHKSGHWSFLAIPQPLPRPNDDFRSPADGRGGSKDGNPSSPAPVARSISHQSSMNVPDQVATKSSKFPTYHRRRGISEDHNFRLDVVARSAPTTTYSSPALSPNTNRKAKNLDSPFVANKEFQVSFNSEASTVTSPVLPAPSSDRSPRHSPILHSPPLSNRNATYVSMHLNNKPPSESFVTRGEGNNSVNVYPLPLPPVGLRPSQTTPIRQNTDKSDGPSMKGQWQKGKLIGRGTFGSVYEATNRETGSLCAMKEVDIVPDDSKSVECIKQLEQEIKVLRTLEHPNIVQYLGSEIIEDRFCIYLEYIHPGSINKYVRDHCGAVTECVVRHFTRHVVSGLAYLHSTNTIHRDIKGANLLVDASGTVKLADFGLSKHLTGQAVNLSLKGSPHWMAPEVLQSVLRNDDNPELAYAVDIWSLGCTVIEMLTGKPPWDELTGAQAMFSVLKKSPPIPEKLSPEGKDFLHKCLQRNPADRATAAMLLEHPFISNVPDRNILSCKQESIGLKLKKLSFSPRDCTTGSQKDIMLHLAAGTGFNHAKLPPSVTFPQSYRDIMDNRGASCRHSPRSTLEVLTSTFSPELNYRSLKIEPSNFFNNTLHNKAGNNSIYGRSRTPGREFPHL